MSRGSWKVKKNYTVLNNYSNRAIGEEIISTSKAAALANMKLADLRDELAMK